MTKDDFISSIKDLRNLPYAEIDNYQQDIVDLINLRFDYKKEKEKIIVNYFYKFLLYCTTELSIKHKEGKPPFPCKYIPGHLENSLTHGPVLPRNTNQPRLMIVGKTVGFEESQYNRNFIGKLGKEMLDLIKDSYKKNNLDFPEIYLTNFVKVYSYILSGGALTKVAKMLSHVLYNELVIYRPDYLIFFSFPSIKSIIKKMLNCELEENEITIGTIPEFNSFKEKKVKILTIPFSFKNEVKESLNYFFAANPNANQEKEEIDYQLILSAKQLKTVLEEESKHIEYKAVALDCEWYGRHPIDGFLRTIQFCINDRPYVIALTDEEGNNIFENWDEAKILLNEFLKNDLTIVGSFIYTDFIWLKHYGIDLTYKYREDLFSIGDVAMATLTIDEQARLDLCLIARKFLNVNRWDKELEEYLKDNNEEMYGKCPAYILFPYAAKDVYYSLKIWKVLKELLEKPDYNDNYKRMYQMILFGCSAIIEMMDVGVLVSEEKCSEFKELFENNFQLIISKLRDKLNWPDFDIKKPRHKVAILFGDQYNEKPVLPPNVKSLNLTPTKPTSNKYKSWSQISEKFLKYMTPSTDSESITSLLTTQLTDDQREILKLIQDASILRNALEKTFGKNGIVSYKCKDGRVRSFLTCTLETGRYSSSKPNLQNLSKSKNELYSEIIGKNVNIRDILVPEEGYCLVENDFISAELFALGVMSEDEVLLEHCQRANLPADHPDYLDLHSNIAVRAFKLNCPPTKEGLKSINKAHLRVAAKSIIYGKNYGRSIESMYNQIKNAGIDITMEDVEQISSNINETYPKAYAQLDELREIPYTQGWQANYFGRIRRFIKTDDAAIMAAQCRESMNFPFQSIVADVLILLLFKLLFSKRRNELGYRILLPWHDAVLLEVPKENAEYVAKEFVPRLVSNIKFRPWNTKGECKSNKEYSFSSDSKITGKE